MRKPAVRKPQPSGACRKPAQCHSYFDTVNQASATHCCIARYKQSHANVKKVFAIVAPPVLISWTMNNHHNPYAAAFASAARRRQEEIQRAKHERWINEVRRESERCNGARLIALIMLLTGIMYATLAYLWIF